MYYYQHLSIFQNGIFFYIFFFFFFIFFPRTFRAIHNSGCIPKPYTYFPCNHTHFMTNWEPCPITFIYFSCANQRGVGITIQKQPINPQNKTLETSIENPVKNAKCTQNIRYLRKEIKLICSSCTLYLWTYKKWMWPII